MYYFTNFGDLCGRLVVSIYMGFLEVPQIMIRNLYFSYKVIYFRNKIIVILNSSSYTVIVVAGAYYPPAVSTILYPNDISVHTA